MLADRDLMDTDSVPSEPNRAYSLFSCLKGNVKVIKNLETGRYEWYDSKSDPSESHNLAISGLKPPDDVIASMNAEWRRIASISLDSDS